MARSRQKSFRFLTDPYEVVIVANFGGISLNQNFLCSRRVGRAVECARLESVLLRKGYEGSNPSLSAMFDRERLREMIGRYLPTKNLSGALLI